MVQGDIVKRTWSKNSQISEHNDILDIWDTGSNIYERWPNGDEFYWKVVSREETQTGFIEILEQEPMWKTPAQVLRREQMPLIKHSASQFQLGAWSVEQVVEKTSSNEVEHMKGGHKAHTHNAQAHRQGGRKVHNYKKNTSLQRPQVQQVKSQVQQVKAQLPTSYKEYKTSAYNIITYYLFIST